MDEQPLMGRSWRTDLFDVPEYLAAVGVRPTAPTFDLLEELHGAHVRTFPFGNVDVLLGTHPGVAPDAIQEQLVRRSRGGYCFEHSQIFAAALEHLGFSVRRALGRVHEPTNTRTHMTIHVELDGERWLCDPGFGFSITGPIALKDGATRAEGDRQFGVRELTDQAPPSGRSHGRRRRTLRRREPGPSSRRQDRAFHHLARGEFAVRESPHGHAPHAARSRHTHRSCAHDPSPRKGHRTHEVIGRRSHRHGTGTRNCVGSERDQSIIVRRGAATVPQLTCSGRTAEITRCPARVRPQPSVALGTPRQASASPRPPPPPPPRSASRRRIRARVPSPSVRS